MNLEKFVANRFHRTRLERIAAGAVFLKREWLAGDSSDATVAGVFAREEKWRGVATKIAIDAGILDEIFAGFLLGPVRWC